VVEEILREQDQRRITFQIMDIINKELQTCLGLENKKLIMERVLLNTTMATTIPNSFLLPKLL
jgi:hypothetical protein